MQKNKIAEHELSKIQNYINKRPGSEGSEIAKATIRFIDSYNNVDCMEEQYSITYCV